MQTKLNKSLKKAYQDLKSREESVESLAVRSSATAEDLPETSFAGQHETYLNISTENSCRESKDIELTGRVSKNR